MKKTLLLLLACFALKLSAQNLKPTCNCSKALDEVIDKVTRIYAGFDDKVTTTKRPEYNRLVSKLKKQASVATTEPKCYAILKAYTAYFKDSHVFILWMSKPASPPSKTVVEKPEKPVDLKQLNDEYAYIRLKYFNQKEVDILDSLIGVSQPWLSKTPNLIIDMRGNGGGNSSSTDKLIQLIYTNPIIYPTWDYRSSPECIASYSGYVEQLKKNPQENDFFIKKYEKLVAEMKANPGKLVSDGADLERKLDAQWENPKRVALLMDKGCGSSTEFFIFESKQSKKVTTFGTNSHGVMDYGDDQNFDICDGTFNLAVPWGRNGWVRQFRIDNIGFKPDVSIPKNEKDWIGFVMRYWGAK